MSEPAGWRWAVAHWPHARWAAWRRRSADLQPSSPTVAQIDAAEWLAYLELEPEARP